MAFKVKKQNLGNTVKTDTKTIRLDNNRFSKKVDNNTILNNINLNNPISGNLPYGIGSAIVGGIGTLVDLADTLISVPVEHQILQYSGKAEWENRSYLTLPTLTDDEASATVNNSIFFNDGKLKIKIAGTTTDGTNIVTDLNSLDDVTVTSPINGQVVVYDGSVFKNTELELTNLKDVSIPSDEPNGSFFQKKDGTWIGSTVLFMKESSVNLSENGSIKFSGDDFLARVNDRTVSLTRPTNFSFNELVEYSAAVSPDASKFTLAQKTDFFRLGGLHFEPMGTQNINFVAGGGNIVRIPDESGRQSRNATQYVLNLEVGGEKLAAFSRFKISNSVQENILELFGSDYPRLKFVDTQYYRQSTDTEDEIIGSLQFDAHAITKIYNPATGGSINLTNPVQTTLAKIDVKASIGNSTGVPYSIHKTYTRGNIVSYNGRIYISLKLNNKNKIPGTNSSIWREINNKTLDKGVFEFLVRDIDRVNIDGTTPNEEYLRLMKLSRDEGVEILHDFTIDKYIEGRSSLGLTQTVIGGNISIGDQRADSSDPKTYVYTGSDVVFIPDAFNPYYSPTLHNVGSISLGYGKPNEVSSIGLYRNSSNEVILKSGTGNRSVEINVSDIPTSNSGDRGANQQLSNLLSPTAINKNLEPYYSNVINLGSNSRKFRSGYIQYLKISTLEISSGITGNLDPSRSNQYNIGQNSRWNYVNCNRVNTTAIARSIIDSSYINFNGNNISLNGKIRIGSRTSDTIGFFGSRGGSRSRITNVRTDFSRTQSYNIQLSHGKINELIENLRRLGLIS